MRRKKWYVGVFLLVLVIVAIFIWPTKKFTLAGVESVEIIDANHSRRRTITRENDSAQVEEIIKRTEDLNLLRHFTIFGRGGFSISVVFYDAEGQIIDSFSTVSKHKIYSDSGKTYFAIFSSVEEAYYESLCAE